MNRCLSCDYYDASVDACNCDDLCYMDGIAKANADALEKLKTMRETHRGSDYQWREYVRWNDVQRILSKVM